MNIFKRISNWLIKKLGGYTEEELIREVDEGTKVCNDDANEALELAMYWHQRYNTEHANYLALLNCHNATAEAKTDALTMAREIKACCVATDDCSECRLAGENGKCNVNEIPCYWEVE